MAKQKRDAIIFVRVPKEVREQLNLLAEHKRWTVNTLVLAILERYVKEHAPRP